MKNPVDGYIHKPPSPKKEILIRLRKLILQTIPNIKEEMREVRIAH